MWLLKPTFRTLINIEHEKFPECHSWTVSWFLSPFTIHTTRRYPDPFRRTVTYWRPTKWMSVDVLLHSLPLLVLVPLLQWTASVQARFASPVSVAQPTDKRVLAVLKPDERQWANNLCSAACNLREKLPDRYHSLNRKLRHFLLTYVHKTAGLSVLFSCLFQSTVASHPCTLFKILCTLYQHAH